MWVGLPDGRVIGVPFGWYPRLAKAASVTRAAFEISPFGIQNEGAAGRCAPGPFQARARVPGFPEPEAARHCLAPVRRPERGSAEAEGGRRGDRRAAIRARLPGLARTRACRVRAFGVTGRQARADLSTDKSAGECGVVAPGAGWGGMFWSSADGFTWGSRAIWG